MDVVTSLKKSIWEEFYPSRQFSPIDLPSDAYSTKFTRFLAGLDLIITSEPGFRLKSHPRGTIAPVFRSINTLYSLNDQRATPLSEDQIIKLHREIVNLDPVLSNLNFKREELHYLITRYHQDPKCREKFKKLVESAKSRYRHDNFERDLKLFIYKFGLDDPNVKKPRTHEEACKKMQPPLSASNPYIIYMGIIFEMLLSYKRYEDSPGYSPDYMSSDRQNVENSILEKVGKSTLENSPKIYYLIRDSRSQDIVRNELSSRLESVRPRYQENRFDPISVFLFKLGLEHSPEISAIKSDVIVANKFGIDPQEVDTVYDRVIKLLLDPNATITHKQRKKRIQTTQDQKPPKVSKATSTVKIKVTPSLLQDSVKKFNSTYHSNGEYKFNSENNKAAIKHFSAILRHALKMTPKLFPNELKGLSNDEMTCIYPARIDDLLLRSYEFLSSKLEPLRTALGFETDFGNLTQKLFRVTKLTDNDAIKNHVQELETKRRQYFLEQYRYIRRQIDSINKFINDPQSDIHKCHIESMKKYTQKLLIALLSSDNHEGLGNSTLEEVFDRTLLTRPLYNVPRDKVEELFKFAKFGFQEFESTQPNIKTSRMVFSPYDSMPPHIRDKAREIKLQGFVES